MVRDAWSLLRVPLSVSQTLFPGDVQFARLFGAQEQVAACNGRPWQYSALISGIFTHPPVASAVVDRDRPGLPMGLARGRRCGLAWLGLAKVRSKIMSCILLASALNMNRATNR
jgi:hypothetical protein